VGADLDDAAIAESLRTALTIAGEHPDSMLPCPACDATTKAKNLASHGVGVSR
jgi:hypothetical protein